jgi:protocatechuate 3,4-dioxygenase beta subunit
MMRALVLVLGLAQVAPNLLQDQARTCEIRGRVTDKDTGQPLARALVRLHAADGQERFSAPTDDSGRFRFTGLMPGQYSGLVEGGPFRSTHATGSLSGGTGRPMVLKDGEVREINVALGRTFAINVRVVDQWGDPLSAITVSAYALERGNTDAPMSSNHTTDDHGRQRVFGLLPGRYIVCAHSDIVGVTLNARRDALLRTCHPSAIDEAEAQPVRVDVPDAGEVEIRMRAGRTYTITGRVVDASGAPAAGAHLMLSKQWLGGSGGTSMLVEGDAQFRIPHVHPGEYAIEASIGGPERSEHARSLERGFVPIRVGDADISVVVPLQKTADVVGRVILEDATAPFRRAPGIPIFVWSRLAEDAGAGALSPTSGLVGDDNLFTMRRVFGRRTMELVNVPRGWYVKSIRYAGNEIIDEPTTFNDSSEPTIELILSNRGAVVTGRVTDDRGNPVQDATVLMFETHRERMSWRAPLSTRASRTGEFRAGPVRGGAYFIVGLPPNMGPIQAGESRRVQRLATMAERVTLGDLDERTVDLRLVIER